MKRFSKIILTVLVAVLALGCLFACDNSQADPCADGHNYKYGSCTVCGDIDASFKPVDYVSQLTLDTNSGTAQLDVTVKTYVDGDTTHFNTSNSIFQNGVLKARYLAINTPESTGKIEPYGKKASDFTHEKLENAAAIRVESDGNKWEADSTGGRYLCWVWYKAEKDGPWRNLNLEILQEGLAIASNTSQNRYGSTCVKALDQAKGLKLNCHSGKNDPDFYYGDAKEVTLKELRCHIASYTGVKVAFEGTVAVNSGSNGVYVQAYDAETESYNGIYVYYGFGADAYILDALKPGNVVRVVGTCTYYEAGGTYQISGLTYRRMKPNDPENTQLITQGDISEVEYTEITADDLSTRTISIDFTQIVDDEEQTETVTLNYSQYIYNTAVKLKNLKVQSIYTTKNGGDSDGAMTLTCKTNDGKTVKIRTIVLKNDNGNVVTEDYFAGKTIDVKGVVESFDGEIQIKLLRLSDATILN